MKKLFMLVLCISLISTLFYGCASQKSAGGGTEKADTAKIQSKTSGSGSKNDTGYKKPVGSKAFVHKIQTQVNVLYGDYYILVGFNGTNDEKGKEINLQIAKKIIENINKKK